jgi:tetratricopeptide (TPR) repeat protein
MEKQQFLDKFEELKSPANAERWAVLQLWLVEAKSDGEIAKALDKDRSTATRKIGDICKHFGTDAKGKKEQRQNLVLLFRRHCLDFEVHPSVYPDWVDGDLRDRLETTTNSQNIPTPEPIPELTTLEFIGREKDLINLANLSKQAKIVLIKAGAGVGKSTLAREFLQTHFKKVIRIEMGLESGNVTPAEEKLSQILRKDFDEQPSQDFGINLDILRERLSDRTNLIAVLIDNLEPALDENYRFREKLRGYDALLTVLGDRDICSFTLITSRRSLIAQRGKKIHEYLLEGLDITAWRQYFHDCENEADSDTLMQMCVAYSGNAKVMDILHGAIKNRFDGNIEVYWNRYKDALLANSELETLISVEMDWLRDNQPDAYKLLFRMGCYRYQDVKTVPFEGLICLLWDVPESRQAWVVDYLSKSSLIEAKGEYYLHPAVRYATKSRLLEIKKDWETANQKAAEFWENDVKNVENINDGLRAFEAYHHYIEIEDHELASGVIVQERYDPWEETQTLGRTFFKLGLLKLMKESALKVISKAKRGYPSSRMYSLLGNILAVTGEMIEAIRHHEASKQIAIEFDLKELEVIAFFNIGMTQIGLFDIDLAKQNFETAILQISESKICQRYMPDLFLCLAFIESIRGYPTEVISFAKKAMDLGGDEHYFSSSMGYAHYFLGKAYKNIGDIDKSFDAYNMAFDISKRMSCTAIDGAALMGKAELYFIKKDIQKALSNFNKSIEILDRIGAKAILAEAYFQLGLTYQAMGKHDQAEEYKAKALELFEEMEAPKQIERVNKAFGGNIQILN